MKNILSHYNIHKKSQIIMDKCILKMYPGEVSASPPIGPIIGQRGINIMEFSKKLNSLTLYILKDTPLRVKIVFLPDKKYLVQKIDIQTNNFRQKLSSLSVKEQSIIVSKIKGTCNYSNLKSIYFSLKK